MIDSSIMSEQIKILHEAVLSIHEAIFDPSRLPLAIIAILLVTLLGMMRGALGGNAMPFYWHIVEIFFGKLGARMNKRGRKQGDLIFRGLLLSGAGAALPCFE